MADAMTLSKLPGEKSGQFNKRLLDACNDQPVTSAQLLVVDGEPVVTLFSETIEATDEHVKEGEADERGEMIPAGDPIIVQVTRASCETDKDAALTQQRMETLYNRADGAVVEILDAVGFRAGWVEDKSGKSHWVQIPVTYLLVSYIAGDEDEDEDAAGEQADDAANGADRLRRPVEKV